MDTFRYFKKDFGVNYFVCHAALFCVKWSVFNGRPPS